jgi:hypothetical protein
MNCCYFFLTHLLPPTASYHSLHRAAAAALPRPCACALPQPPVPYRAPPSAGHPPAAPGRPVPFPSRPSPAMCQPLAHPTLAAPGPTPSTGHAPVRASCSGVRVCPRRPTVAALAAAAPASASSGLPPRPSAAQIRRATAWRALGIGRWRMGRLGRPAEEEDWGSRRRREHGASRHTPMCLPCLPSVKR